jgi:hypothetical protein
MIVAHFVNWFITHSFVTIFIGLYPEPLESLKCMLLFHEGNRADQKANFIDLDCSLHWGACGSVVVKAQCYKPEGRGFDTQWGEFFKIYQSLLATLAPGVYAACNRNEYQQHKNNNVSGE